MSDSEKAEFKIGGKTILVRSMMFEDLENCKNEIQALSPDMDWIDYAGNVLTVVAKVLEPDDMERRMLKLLELKKACTLPEMRDLSAQFSNLLRISGFIMSGEQEAAQEGPGTGISTAASPNSQSEGFVEATQDSSGSESA